MRTVVATCTAPTNADPVRLRRNVGANRCILIERTESDSFLALEWNAPDDEEEFAVWAMITQRAMQERGVVGIEASESTLEEFYSTVRHNYMEGGKPCEEFPLTGRTWEVIGVRGNQSNGVEGFALLEEFPLDDGDVDLPF